MIDYGESNCLTKSDDETRENIKLRNGQESLRSPHALRANHNREVAPVVDLGSGHKVLEGLLLPSSTPVVLGTTESSGAPKWP